MFNYPYYELYEYEYVFSPKNCSGSQQEGAGESKESLKTMYSQKKVKSLFLM